MTGQDADEKSFRKAVTVSELTREIKGLLESEFSGLWVEGEISNFKTYPSGHSYFTLKDENAQMRAVIWKGSKRHVKFDPKDGDQVVCRGRVSLYEKRGEYQLSVEFMEPVGLGALQAAYEKLKKKLEAEGLFEEERKKPLPYIPWSVGIVTSPTGAVIRDMVRTINRRFPGIRIVMNPVPVQGEGAAEKIAGAIAEFNEYGKVDVIIAGRGGGSLEDLWAFNEEVVARAIAGSKIPVVSAVGHETDFTIADFVADLRASTPTAAAEQIAPERAAVEEMIEELADRMTGELRDLMESSAQTVDSLAERAERTVRSAMEIDTSRVHGFSRSLKALSPKNQLAMKRRMLTEIVKHADNALSRQITAKRSETSSLITRFTAQKPERWISDRRDAADRARDSLAANFDSIIKARRKTLEVNAGKLGAYDPLKVLERGYGIVTSKDGKKVYKSVTDLTPGAKINIRMHDGEKKATIDHENSGEQEKLF